jgi:pimeloyl-ACP methyl ester carboxylesterase/alkylhydroperoxidase family enzyme
MHPTVTYHKLPIQGCSIFYREAGHARAPVILLLHGFPTSSHMFRNLIPLLAGKYRVIAPDLPGFGFSEMPPRERFSYTFDHLANVMHGFTEALGLERYVLYVFDYGAPVGFRLAMAQPGKVAALISQNGNAYEEGLSEGWSPIQRYWREPTLQNREALRAFLSRETTRWQYTQGATNADTALAPESWFLDQTLLDRPGADDIQLDLFGDYQSNVALYPRFQAYFREHRPPLLAVWGKNDPFFLPAGAEAFARDNPNAYIRFVDSGHFPLETHAPEIARDILNFLARVFDEQPARLFQGQASNDEAAPLRALNALLGFTPNLALAMNAEKTALEQYVAGLHSLSDTGLSPIEQQIAMLTASYCNRADYGVALHGLIARRLGASELSIREASDGKPITGDPKLQALQALTRAIVHNRGDAGDAELKAFQEAGYTARHAVALALAIALKTFANTVAHLSRTPLDPQIRS